MINLMLKGSSTLSENITTINLFLITFSKEMQPQKVKRHEQSVLQKRDYLRTSFYREKRRGGEGGRGASAEAYPHRGSATFVCPFALSLSRSRLTGFFL
jgi:hypothetical protein